MYFSRVQLQSAVQRSSQLSQMLKSNVYGLHQLLWDLFPEDKNRTFLFREEIAKEQLKDHTGIRGESLFYLVSEQEPAQETPLFRVQSKIYSPVIEVGQTFAFKLRANPVVARKAAGKKHSVRHDVVMDAQVNLLNELAGSLQLSVPHGQKKSALRREVVKVLNNQKNSSCESRLHEITSSNERYDHLLQTNLSAGQLVDLSLKAAPDSALETWLRKKGDCNGFELVTGGSVNGRERLKFQAESYRWHAMPKKGRNAGFSTVDFEGELRVTEPILFKELLFKGMGPAKAFGCGLMMIRRA